MYKVFYLTGGSTNFVCQSVVGIMPYEKAQKEVAELQKMGYKAMSVKDGHIVGGYCSYSDFDTVDAAQKYYIEFCT